MDPLTPSPRCNSATINSYDVGQRVRIVGTVRNKNQSEAIFETSDGGQIRVILAHGSTIYDGATMEVLGSYNGGNAVQEIGSIDLGSTFGA
jgi:hypothetical protein